MTSIARADPSAASASTSDGFHARSAEEMLARLGTQLESGLSAERASRLLDEFGPNELASAPPTPTWRHFVAQFAGLVVWILIVAAGVSMVLGEWVDALAIVAILLLNAILGFIQEEKAERSLSALQELASPLAKVIRDGKLEQLAASQIVPGDVIEVEAGDFVPADTRLVQSFGLQVQEAALTGESAPVSKDAASILAPETPLAERSNMIYMGTVVSAGKASAVVAATGMRTELGRIAGMLQHTEREQTPLQRRLAELGRVLIVLCLSIVAVILALRLMRGDPLLEVFMLSVGLAVAAVPEGLPAVVTVALALGLQRMVRRSALIRKLPSVETLGSVTVICSDKTGTLTRNEMTVREILAGNRWYRVSGAGYAPRGEFSHSDAGEGAPSSERVARTVSDPAQEKDLALLLTAGAWCGHARVVSKDNEWTVIGDPTEGALVVAAKKAGIDAESSQGRVVYEIPFDSQRRAMSVAVQAAGTNSTTLYAKGAPEAILDKCRRARRNSAEVPLDDRIRSQILEANAQMASGALRVLGLAYQELPGWEQGKFGKQRDVELESDLIFLGLAGMIDPPREEAKSAVATCQAAGIKPVMITGDHPGTAIAIARELQIAGADERALAGHELEALSDEALAQRVAEISVYARVSAADKLRVVKAWQRRSQVVAMTGDGVNDAPAVKAADIGIAMGITGTDVTKAASDMVLMDDNFASIVNAVEEGRGIFDNIQKFIIYLLSCNTSEVLLVFVAAVAGWPTPLVAVQLLWINLVTDGFPALALAMEPPERDIMQRAPRPPREPVINLNRGVTILGHGALMAVVAIAGFWWFLRDDSSGLERAQTAAFCIVAYTQLCYSLSCRSQRFTMPELGAFTNPYLLGAIVVSAVVQYLVVSLPLTRRVFESVPLAGADWLVITGLALIPVTVIEVGKLLVQAFRRRPAASRGAYAATSTGSERPGDA